MNQDYIPGEGCECSARCSCECGCDVDWTPREVYELRATISDMETRHAATMLHTQSIVDEANELREQRDEALSDLEFRRNLFKLQEHLFEDVRSERDRLLVEREQWRMSSVCRELREQRDTLAEVAQAVWDRWETPLWKDHPPTALVMNKLRDALAAVKGGSHDH